MMPKSSEIEGLLSRLETATGPDREIDRWLELLLVQNGRRGCFKTNESWVKAARERRWATDHFTRSIDAALDLVERCLPGWKLSFHLGGLWGEEQPGAHLAEPDFAALSRKNKRYEQSRANAPTLPLAILIALLRALSARPRP